MLKGTLRMNVAALVCMMSACARWGRREEGQKGFTGTHWLADNLFAARSGELLNKC